MARAALALACLASGACSSDSGAPADSPRVRMLAALPEDALDRGVYLFDGDVDEDLSPGSLVAPIIGGLIPQADVVVETGAPPVTLLAGLPEDAELTEQMERVGDVSVLGSDEDVAAVRNGLEEGTDLAEPLVHLARSEAPVGWAGPLPGCQPGTLVDPSEGTLVLALSDASAELTVTGPAAQELEGVVEVRLTDEGPAHSPGKPWRSILTDAEVGIEGARLVIEAVPVDLPGGLLRQLLDTRGLSFLRPVDC